MKTGMKAVASVALAVALAGASTALAQPQVSIQQEEQAHPRIVQAIRDAEGSLAKLREAPDDFGGRKAKAIADLQTAIHSMRAALFYRLHMDDAALDAINLR